MIKIAICVNKDQVYDEFTNKKTSLVENGLALRRLEEIKLKLLDLEYESEFEVEKDLKEGGE